MELPEPGIGGYDYPRGPYGATGFPGSTPAALARTGHTQSRPEGARGLRQLDAEQNQAEWADLPTRRANGTPRQPYARQMRSTSPEHREIPQIGGAPGSENVRNQIAQRYKARPELVRGYRPSPNPGKTGARLTGPSQYHPGTTVFGDPEGGPIPGMAYNPDGTPPQVYVQSRFTEYEGGSQEGYAMNRDLYFSKGGIPAPVPHGAAPHLRGGRYDGTRYFGALTDQQRIGRPDDAYGIARARGPRHRPVRFETPAPWAANYYDEAPETDGPADMIHQSPSMPHTRKVQTPRRSRGRTARG
jgi:hypothetical protein